MSVTASLSNALSGLTASAKAAEVVSSNVANATTEGYGLRSVNTSAASLSGVGTGVRVDGVSRNVNEAVIADRRAAGSQLSNASTRATYFANVEAAIGLPAAPGSLDQVLVQFEAALVDAASRPDQEVRLLAAGQAAQAVTEKLNAISDAVQDRRMGAEREIARQVETLNTALRQIEELNSDITLQRAAGKDALGLMDQRQTVIDTVARIVPVSVLTRDNGQVALISSGGAVLLDGKPAELQFSAANTITPEMTVASGALTYVSINGQSVDMARETNMLQGGSLAGLFEIRDDLAVSTQSDLDAFARDLIARFSDPSVDPSLPPGDPGLFTDAGGALDPLAETGLAQRMSLNALVDPTQGRAALRLRDGLGAAAQGAAGDATQLMAFLDVLNAVQVPAGAPAGAAEESVFSLGSSVLSRVTTDGQQVQAAVAFASAKWDAMRLAELEDGVDTDAEMQKLLQIEQAYAANARVIQTIDEMLDTLSRI